MGTCKGMVTACDLEVYRVLDVYACVCMLSAWRHTDYSSALGALCSLGPTSPVILAIYTHNWGELGARSKTQQGCLKPTKPFLPGLGGQLDSRAGKEAHWDGRGGPAQAQVSVFRRT